MAEMLPVVKEHPNFPDELPVLPLKGAIAFPLTLIPLSVGLERSMKLVDDAMSGNRLMLLSGQKEELIEKPTVAQLYSVGTVAVIHQLSRTSDKSYRLVAQGLERVRITSSVSELPYLKATFTVIPDETKSGMEVDALRHVMLDALRKMTAFSDQYGEELVDIIEGVTDTRQLIYIVASTLSLVMKKQQEVLEIDSLEDKLKKIIEWLQHEIAIRELGRKITSETKERLTKEQKDYFLREQVRSIKKELGEGDDDSEIGNLKKRLKEANLPEEAKREADRELSRLLHVPAASPEHGIILTYLDWLASLPWEKMSGGTIDIVRARKILDEDHYDLEKIKDRLIEYLATKKLRQERKVKDVTREPLLCLVGPPGVGKTSLGKSIARALN